METLDTADVMSECMGQSPSTFTFMYKEKTHPRPNIFGRGTGRVTAKHFLHLVVHKSETVNFTECLECQAMYPQYVAANLQTSCVIVRLQENPSTTKNVDSERARAAATCTDRFSSLSQSTPRIGRSIACFHATSRRSAERIP